jgi:hypothetical protein
MKVAWQFIARKHVTSGPVPVGYGMIGLAGRCLTRDREITHAPGSHRPYGTDPFSHPFLAINCQLPSLRPSGTKARLFLHIFDSTSPEPFQPEDEPEHEDEKARQRGFGN